MFVQLKMLNSTSFATSELGNVFTGGILKLPPKGHEDFEKHHVCNKFCTFFDVPTDYEIWESSSSIARPQGSDEQGI
jgi:hypothetical protein